MTPRRSPCPIAYSLDLFGDRWSLLILRDMLLLGKRSYGEFLGTGEGIATNVLADRLQRLQDAGLITKATDPANKRRNVYTATARGWDTLPILLELIRFGGMHDPKSPVSGRMIERIRTDRDGLIAEYLGKRP